MLTKIILHTNMYLVRVGFTLTCAQQLPGLRAVSTSIVEFAAAAKGAGASKVKFLPPEERLQYLRKAEIRLGHAHSLGVYGRDGCVRAIYSSKCYVHRSLCVCVCTRSMVERRWNEPRGFILYAPPLILCSLGRRVGVVGSRHFAQYIKTILQGCL